MNVLVLGVGSILMTDDGIGVRAVEELQRRFHIPDNVEVIDGGTSGLDLLPYLADRDYLIIIDAVKSGAPPGTVLMAEGEDVPARFRTRISPHQLGISELLAAAMLTGELPKQLVLFGIEPKTIEMGLCLSPEVRAGLDKMLTVVADYLHTIGCRIEPREEPEAQETHSFWGKL